MIKTEMKKRNWTFELYNDSSSPDWEDFLNSSGIPYTFIYHDKDTNPTGEKKVPHYHVMICSDGPITYQKIILPPLKYNILLQEFFYLKYM